MSDQVGVAANLDPDMINAWGLAPDDASHGFWIAENETGKAAVVDDAGAPLAKIDIGDGVTGAAKNPSTTAFLMHAQAGCAAAKMLFSTEGGQIIAVNEDVDAARGVIVADRSAAGASYKGLAIIESAGVFLLLAPDFHNGRIDVFDENFQLVNVPTAPPIFVDAQVPAGYAPFNVVAINSKVYVAFAVQDADKGDEVAGAGLGMVDEFDVQGNFLRTIAPAGQLLNAPWGIALAPSDFCKSTANSLLIGNFGDGHITAFDVTTGRLIGQLSNDKGTALAIDGLWALGFGTGQAGATNKLYFTAGPAEESHGLFGYLQSGE